MNVDIYEYRNLQQKGFPMMSGDVILRMVWEDQHMVAW